MKPAVLLFSGLVAAAYSPVPPAAIIIVSPRGEQVVPVTMDRGSPALAEPLLAGPLGATSRIEGERAAVTVGGIEFAFDLTAPVVRAGDSVYPLFAPAYVSHDTLFVPLQWLVESVPRALGARYRWIPTVARFVIRDSTTAPVAVAAAGRESIATSSSPSRVDAPAGLRRAYTIVVDPGHGGPDPGNPGVYLPRGQTEKDVVLAIGRLLRAELVRRGFRARLTRATDTLIDLRDRGASCVADCDLFVSIHLNSMPEGRRQSVPNGVETYFLSAAKSEDQARVARMENAAIRFETSASLSAGDPLGMILRSLQENEYLRESARLAEFVQGRLADVHPGKNRGVQQAGLVVLSTAGRPAILVEAGFATNREDGAFLGSALGQRKIANAVAEGILAYLVEYEGRTPPVPAGGPAR